MIKRTNIWPPGINRNSTDEIPAKCIGMIVRDFNSPFSMAIAAGGKSYANEKGYSVIVASSENNHACEKKLLQLLAVNNVRGIIVAPVMDDAVEIEYLFHLKRIFFPFVLLEDVKGIKANLVAADHSEAFSRALQYLMECGHTKIVHFAGSPRSSQAREKIDAFRYAFSESTMEFNAEMVVPIGSQYDESFNNTIQYFATVDRDSYPTAIICCNDDQTFAVMNALKELHLRVPDDISVIGIEGTFYTRNYALPLTSIRVPLNEIGRKAAEILVRNVESTDILTEERIIFKSEFVVRESTKESKPEGKNRFVLA